MNDKNYDRGYNGNPQLKKSQRKIEWTEDLKEEYIRCATDIIYFAEKYVYIVELDRGFVPISLYEYQKDMIMKCNDYRYFIGCCSRQSGKTTTATVIILHYILFNSDKVVALLANKGEAAREILNRIKMSYEALPEWLQQGIKEWNKGSITLENGSKVLAAATSSTSIRGKSVNLLYIDEAAFCENWTEFFSAVFPTISQGQSTKIILTSTPNGLNHFYKTMCGAKEGTNGYKFIEVPWHRVPGRTQEWMQETLAAMDYDYEKFDREFNIAFQGSSGTLINGQTLKNLVPKHPINVHDGLSQYELPDRTRKYVLVADVSRGKGLDYSAFQVIDVTEMPYKQVCVYRNNLITPIDYAVEIYKVSKMYNDSVILIESNDIGGQVADTLYHEYECDNLIFTENGGARGKRISMGFGNKSIDKGIRTTKTVKAVGCSILKLLIEQQQLIINDHETIFELSRFSKKGNSYEAESGCHDDLVMCLVLFAWLSDQPFFKEFTDISTLMKLRDKTDEEIENSLFTFAVILNDGIDEINEIESTPYHEFMDGAKDIFW